MDFFILPSFLALGLFVITGTSSNNPNTRSIAIKAICTELKLFPMDLIGL